MCALHACEVGSIPSTSTFLLMQHKLKRFLSWPKRYRTYRIVNNRSQRYLNNIIRRIRASYSCFYSRGALAFIQFKAFSRVHNWDRVRPRKACPITGRNRSFHRHCGVSRLRIKDFSSRAFLLGFRKSS
jgi:ribosomal protein S14